MGGFSESDIAASRCHHPCKGGTFLVVPEFLRPDELVFVRGVDDGVAVALPSGRPVSIQVDSVTHKNDVVVHHQLDAYGMIYHHR